MTRSCPHERIQYCPLYVESHYARGLGCVDDPCGDCLVTRGKMDYAAQVEVVRAVDPRMIAQLAFAEQAAASREQRARNMRLAGIH
jgi:hypothetical protein